MFSFIMVLIAVFLVSFIGRVVYYLYDINKLGLYAANTIDKYTEAITHTVPLSMEQPIGQAIQWPLTQNTNNINEVKTFKECLLSSSSSEGEKINARQQLTKLIGEHQTAIIEHGYNPTLLKEALAELDNQVGMVSIKKEIRNIVNSKLHGLERQRQGKIVKDDYFGNVVLIGNPGTGKSTLARILSKIIIALGYADDLYSSNKQDYVEGVQGASTKKTLNLLEVARQNRVIVFLDEAYSLVTNEQDSVGIEAINTIVKFVEENKDVIFIAAGYKKEMIDFLNRNTGLKSRFKYELEVEDYSNNELVEIGARMIRSKGYRLLDEKAHKSLLQAIKEENIMVQKSGNARLARNIIEKAIERQGSRCYQFSLKGDDLDLLIADDFYITKESEKTLEEALEELSKFIGMDAVKKQVNELIAVAQHNKQMDSMGNKISKISLHSVFTGNPGTGKTTVARILGDIYKTMGILPKSHVVEVSRQDLVAGYVGQTAVKMKNVIEQALGGILFIDEAYTLTGKGDNDFGQEAIDTLLKAMEDYRDSLMVIVAGYTSDMDTFISSNAGLSSRFNNRIHFEDYTGAEMMQIFESMAKKEGFIISPQAKEQLEGHFETMYLVRDNAFGNGRDVRNIFENIKKKMAVRLQTMKSPKDDDYITITLQDVSNH